MTKFIFALSLVVLSFSLANAKSIECSNSDNDSKVKLVYEMQNEKMTLKLMDKNTYSCRDGFEVNDEDMINGVNYHYCLSDSSGDVLVKRDVKNKNLVVQTIGIYSTTSNYNCP